ncbi:alpha/beta hydrolase [endosymbiont GvMRE of Glomus versiforme]|uniref:alpha/beta hydrolase n=1 Tax=endosymbiont GvMRE of Glomus versiforme TaxID=2039283 RepID=UPI000ECEA94B|nr:alpha/beta fold hydrolase [endosymbiont GvMRE of Glomus versiforme]RHZ36897.1 Alpha/beta hydrolase family protein [endosymbiont GvMRE of Glomus versiforme]
MLGKIKKMLIFLWKKRVFPNSQGAIKDSELSVDQINTKIRDKLKTRKNFIVLSRYETYFSFLKDLGLWKSFQILSTKDSIVLRGSNIRPLVINENNDKVIIFCHGVTSNQWGLFYCIHLVLQLGYQVVIYDARNHGISGKSYTTLGKVEAYDLEDIVNWTKKYCQPQQIGLYGFSMGAATLLFWLSLFQNQHPEVKFLICEAPFDSFSAQFKNLTRTKANSWRRLIAERFLKYALPSSQNLEDVNPISALPDKLSLKLLLLHGTADITISWKASYNIWEHFQKNPVNRPYINCYFFIGADHGEVPFIGDALVGKLRWIGNKRQKSEFSTFTELLVTFLKKNF